MAPIDPIFEKQFGWADSVDPAQLLSDPAYAERMLASYRDDPQYQPPRVPNREVQIDGPLGEQSLRLRIYTPVREDSGRAALVWVHGGGFAMGDLDMLEADGVSRELADRAGVVVVSVDYHLANAEIFYPSLHQEVLAAFQWVHAHTDELRVDPDRISLGGASAGGNLAMGATLELRARGETLPRSLVLVYPALHEVHPEPIEPVDLSTAPVVLRLPSELYAYMMANYRGAPQGDARYSTVDGHDLRNLPDTLVIPAEFDDLRPSADRFAHDAAAAGTNVTSILGVGAAHGFLGMTPAVPATEKALDDIVTFLA